MRYTIFILSLLFPFLSIVAQPKHEVRAAWVTAVYGLDWPSQFGLKSATRLHEAGFASNRASATAR